MSGLGRLQALGRTLMVALAVGLAAPVGAAAEARFAEEIARFGELDRTRAPPQCPVLFVGSSSIRFWTSLTEDMAPLPVVNRGFGGAHIADVNHYFDQTVRPYAPRAIVFYAGENDLNAGASPQAAATDFARFMTLKTEALGATPVFFVSAKPSKLRFDQLAAQGELNAAVRAMAKERPDLAYIDVTEVMLEDGAPKDIFLADGLHMNPDGYALWREVVRAALFEAGVDRQTCPD